MELSCLNNFLWFLQKHNFLKCQITVVLSREALCNFFRSCWASPSINLVVFLVLGWLHFTILKALNLTGQPVRLEVKEDF